jgi:S-layer family protein
MQSPRPWILSCVLIGLAVPLAAQTPETRPQTYGTTAVSYIEVPAEAFLPLSSSTAYSQIFGAARYSTNCTGLCFGAPLRLPSGATIVSLELDYFDGDADDFAIGSLVQCDSTAANCSNHPAAGAGPADCLMAGQICSGAAHNVGHGTQSADLTADGITVDNTLGSYRLWAGTSGTDAGTALAGMIVGYVLQVSPAPAVPTFNDVPPSHPFFQYIEALAASGITGGCGGGNYCPDNPLTRGQMAVFLAKALGLQWP